MNNAKEELSLIDCGISHLTALSLSFGRVNQPERAEDESVTGDEPSWGTHCGSIDKGKTKTKKKKERKKNDVESKEAIIWPWDDTDTDLHLLMSRLVGRLKR